MFSCHSRYCFACKTESYYRKGVCMNQNCVLTSSWGSKEWWASNLFLASNTSTGNAEHVSYLFSRRLMFYFLEL